MSAITRPSIENVSSLESSEAGGSVAIPPGVQLATDTAANLVAAAPTTVGQLRIASDTGDLYISDSDNKFHPSRAKAFAMDYTWNYAIYLTGSPDTTFGTGALTAGSDAASNRLVTDALGGSLTNGVKVPPGFGTGLAVVTWESSGGSPTGFAFMVGNTNFRKFVNFEQGVTSGSFVFDTSGLTGFDDQNMAGGTVQVYANCYGSSPATALDLTIDMVAGGSEFFYQTS